MACNTPQGSFKILLSSHPWISSISLCPFHVFWYVGFLQAKLYPRHRPTPGPQLRAWYVVPRARQSWNYALGAEVKRLHLIFSNPHNCMVCATYHHLLPTQPFSSPQISADHGEKHASDSFSVSLAIVLILNLTLHLPN